MNEEQELEHLRAPSVDPKQRMIDYWGRRAEKAEDERDRLREAIDVFSKATSLPGGPSLAMQQHDPTWQAWKALCVMLASKR